MKKIAEAHLSDSAYDQKEAESLMVSARKPKPSRKHRGRRGPRESQQKSRVKVRDEHLDTFDRHLSLSGKHVGSSFWSYFPIEEALESSDRHIRVSAVGDPNPRRKTIEDKRQRLLKTIGSISSKFSRELDSLLDYNSHSGAEVLKTPSVVGSPDDVKYSGDMKILDGLDNIYDKIKASKLMIEFVGDIEEAKSKVMKLWNAPDFNALKEMVPGWDEVITAEPGRDEDKALKCLKVVYRAGILANLLKYILNKSEIITLGLDKNKITENLLKMSKDPNFEISSELNFSNFLIKYIVDIMQNKPNDDLSVSDFMGAEEKLNAAVDTVSTLVKVIKTIRDFSTSIDKVSDELLEEEKEATLESVAEEYGVDPDELIIDKNKESAKELDKLLSFIEGDTEVDWNSMKKIIPYDDVFKELSDKLEEEMSQNELYASWLSDPSSPSIDEDVRKQFEWIQSAIKNIGDLKDAFTTRMSSQISNEKLKTRMNKLSAYHGVLQQGHPTGPTNTVYKSIDSRYIGPDHLKSIIASAKAFLDTGWFKSGWDHGAVDARHRAALDLAIATADQAIYQSKIDSPTYERLLNELSGQNVELFDSTYIPESGARVASSTTTGLDQATKLLRGSDVGNKIDSEIRKNGVPEVGTILLAADRLKDSNRYLSDRLIRLAAEIHFRSTNNGKASASQENNMADNVRVSVDLETLVKVAYNNPGAREALLPIIAAKKDLIKSKASGKKSLAKKPEEHKATGHKKEKKSMANKKLTQQKAGGKVARKKKHKVSSDVRLSSDDASW